MVLRWDGTAVRSEALRFLVSGGINTAVTFAAYWVLLPWLGYWAAYTLAFLLGIVIAYQLNTRFVFRVKGTVRGAATFPLVYAVQLGLGLLVLWIWSDLMGLPPAYGVFATVAVTIPATFVLSRIVLKRP